MRACAGAETFRIRWLRRSVTYDGFFNCYSFLPRMNVVRTCGSTQASTRTTVLIRPLDTCWRSTSLTCLTGMRPEKSDRRWCG